MIGFVSCSNNGNDVPTAVKDGGLFYLLIPILSSIIERLSKRSKEVYFFVLSYLIKSS
jgi:hypothetical protein